MALPRSYRLPTSKIARCIREGKSFRGSYIRWRYRLYPPDIQTVRTLKGKTSDVQKVKGKKIKVKVAVALRRDLRASFIRQKVKRRVEASFWQALRELRSRQDTNLVAHGDVGEIEVHIVAIPSVHSYWAEWKFLVRDWVRFLKRVSNY